MASSHLFFLVFRPNPQKHNEEWFLLGNFVDLVSVYSLQVISRNHSGTFLLIDLQKTKQNILLLKVKY